MFNVFDAYTVIDHSVCFHVHVYIYIAFLYFASLIYLYVAFSF